jgi:hypothetical protein
MITATDPGAGRASSSTTGARVDAYTIHGVSFTVESDVPIAARAVADSYGVFADPDPHAGALSDRLILQRVADGYRLVDATGRAALVRSEQAAVVGLFDLVVHAVLDGLRARGLLAIHAGVVAFEEGAVILAGPSGHGKSTLTLALVRAGGALLTDEMAVIATDDRTILPFPRGLHVRPDTLAMFPELAFVERRERYDLGGGSEWSIGARDLAAAYHTGLGGPTRLAGVVVLSDVPDPGRPMELTPLSPAVTALDLLRGTPAGATDFAGTMRRLGTITAGARCARLRMGPLDASAHAVRTWLRAST